MTLIRLCLLAGWFNNNLYQIFNLKMRPQEVSWRCDNKSFGHFWHDFVNPSSALLEDRICYVSVWKMIALLEKNRAYKNHVQSYKEKY